jgi:hypothetical protein
MGMVETINRIPPEETTQPGSFSVKRNCSFTVEILPPLSFSDGF